MLGFIKTVLVPGGIFCLMHFRECFTNSVEARGGRSFVPQIFIVSSSVLNLKNLQKGASYQLHHSQLSL